MRIFQAHHGHLMVQRAHDVTIVRQARALAARGERMALFVARTAPEDEVFRFYGVPEDQRFELVQLPALRRQRWPRISVSVVFELACLRELRRRLRDEATPAVLYLRELKLARFFLRFRRWLGVPIVFEFHDFRAPEPAFTEPACDPTEAAVLSRADAVITMTRALAETIGRAYRLEREIVPIPHGVELDDEPAPVDTAAWAGRAVTLCYLGQLYRLQGVEVALEALTQVPRCRLLLIGGNQQDVARLTAHAQALGCADRVTLTGYVPPGEVRQRMAEADIFLLPSLAEGRMPYVAHTKLYEYRACRRPIVASDLPSVREELTDGETALLVTPGSARSLAEAVKQMLASPRLARRLAEGGYDLARRHTYEARAARLLEVFHRVAPGAPTEDRQSQPRGGGL